MLHCFSSTDVNSFKKIHLLLQHLTLTVYHTHHTCLLKKKPNKQNFKHLFCSGKDTAVTHRKKNSKKIMTYNMKMVQADFISPNH